MSTCAEHTKCPDNYLAWLDWADEKMRRHYQVRCDGCGLYAIWKRKPADVPGEAFSFNVGGFPGGEL